MDHWIPISLLVAALILFLLSARPWPTLLRLGVILVGVLAIAGAVYLILRADEHYGLFRVVADLWAHRLDPSQSVFVTSLARNEGSVERHVVPLLDLYLAIGALLGLLAVIALTPGETIERIVRPTIFLLGGMMIGSVVSLSLVAVGFGGVVDPRGYAGLVRDKDVYDGDTIWLGETSLRLFGVEAPERNQQCRSGRSCGQLSREYLVAQLRDALVRCEARTTRRGSVKEALGRPLVQCYARPRGGEEFDIGRRMIESGHATVYEREHPTEYEGLRFNPQREDAIAECWEIPRHGSNEQDAPPQWAGRCT